MCGVWARVVLGGFDGGRSWIVERARIGRRTAREPRDDARAVGVCLQAPDAPGPRVAEST
jgi:hypothetical protein